MWDRRRPWKTFSGEKTGDANSERYLRKGIGKAVRQRKRKRDRKKQRNAGGNPDGETGE